MVETKDGVATVIDSNLLTGNLRVKIGDDGIPFNVNREDVRIIKKCRQKRNAEEEKLAKELED